MPKLKTHKGTVKRFRLTKNGKVMRMKAGRTHLRRKKGSSKNSDFRHAVPSTVKSIVKTVKVMAGSAAK
ncbi:MAG: 50S ribosomal protein L35 [Chloroflexi bacterium]|nr:MAG: 50S ribosomal protein L35 [Chloroflexota bacterium]